MRIHPSLLLVLLAACAPKAPPPAPVEAAPPPPPPHPSVAKLLEDMDLKADPCVDFYQYACGGWLAKTPLPADKPSWTRSFSTIAESNRAYIRELLEAAAADPAPADADRARIGQAYKACMDEPAVEAAGLGAAQPLLARIDAMKSAKDLWPVVYELHQAGVSVLWSFDVDGDFKDPQLVILHMGHGGLGLPDRDFYLKTDEKSVQLLKDYEAHVATILGLGGDKGAAASAKRVVAFETAIAKLHWERAKLRDPTQTYNKIDRAGLEAQVKGVPWGAYFAQIGAPGLKDVNVDVPAVLAGVVSTAAKADVPTLKAYLRYHLLADLSPHLGKAFVDADFAFYGQKVRGQKEMEPRAKRCVRFIEGTMGELVGRSFVKDRFPGDSKDVAVSMIQGIQDAFEASLPDLAWMDEATRKAAIDKKNTLRNKIGYPDVWRDYSSLTVDAGNHAANAIAASRFDIKDRLSRVGKPADPNLWHMPPAMVNAYYHPLYNEMAYPAGILQPPFFDRTAPAMMNFGAIGMVMGHELTHGFDDSGSQFDPQGRMIPWWSAEIRKKFEEQTACVSAQYSAFEVEPGLNVNGDLTLGENIADIGGAKAAFRAWKAYDAKNPLPAATPTLTNDQIFWVAMAQGWCTVASPEYLKTQVMTDPHSPPRFRVNGPVQNLPDFHRAFQCELGEPMRPQKACTVW